uniref:NADH dehydrogenase subunit 6 n=1 Tax=Atteva charopis TaxID=1371471 RepID=UPI0024110BAA|nr:NADH dehydrogenase subunit 6 [Atteva charopis]WEG93575.1 NADH dehydrogenase subunit 6 [Atteva charopis]
MMKIFLCLCLIFLSLYMYTLNHPLSMGLMILLQTFLTCLISGMMTNTYWFSYILFLTFLGGLLVLFIYVSSIASNEIFYYSFNKNMFMIIFLFISFILSFFFKNNLNWFNLFSNEEMNKFNYNFFFNNENMINLSKLYNNQTYLIMPMLIIYLFITLIAVVKITNIFYGPIRSNLF